MKAILSLSYCFLATWGKQSRAAHTAPVKPFVILLKEKMAGWQFMEHRFVCGLQERHSLAHCLWTASANTELSCFYIYKSGLFFQCIKCFVRKVHPTFHWFSIEKCFASQRSPASTTPPQVQQHCYSLTQSCYQQKRGQQVLISNNKCTWPLTATSQGAGTLTGVSPLSREWIEVKCRDINVNTSSLRSLRQNRNVLIFAGQ